MAQNDEPEDPKQISSQNQDPGTTKQQDADINAIDNDGYTALHFAAAEGKLDAVEDLIKKGANIEAKTNNNYTPLHFAAVQGNLDVVKHLVEKGADVNTVDGGGDTALHFAAKEGHSDVIKHLIEKGARLDIKDVDGNTPVDLAQDNQIKNFITTSKERAQASQQEVAQQQKPSATTKRRPLSIQTKNLQSTSIQDQFMSTQTAREQGMMSDSIAFRDTTSLSPRLGSTPQTPTSLSRVLNLGSPNPTTQRLSRKEELDNSNFDLNSPSGVASDNSNRSKFAFDDSTARSLELLQTRRPNEFAQTLRNTRKTEFITTSEELEKHKALTKGFANLAAGQVEGALQALEKTSSDPLENQKRVKDQLDKIIAETQKLTDVAKSNCETWRIYGYVDSPETQLKTIVETLTLMDKGEKGMLKNILPEQDRAKLYQDMKFYSDAFAQLYPTPGTYEYKKSQGMKDHLATAASIIVPSAGEEVVNYQQKLNLSDDGYKRLQNSLAENFQELINLNRQNFKESIIHKSIHELEKGEGIKFSLETKQKIVKTLAENMFTPEYDERFLLHNYQKIVGNLTQELRGKTTLRSRLEKQAGLAEQERIATPELEKVGQKLNKSFASLEKPSEIKDVSTMLPKATLNYVKDLESIGNSSIEKRNAIEQKRSNYAHRLIDVFGAESSAIYLGGKELARGLINSPEKVGVLTNTMNTQKDLILKLIDNDKQNFSQSPLDLDSVVERLRKSNINIEKDKLQKLIGGNPEMDDKSKMLDCVRSTDRFNELLKVISPAFSIQDDPKSMVYQSSRAAAKDMFFNALQNEIVKTEHVFAEAINSIQNVKIKEDLARDPNFQYIENAAANAVDTITHRINQDIASSITAIKLQERGGNLPDRISNNIINHFAQEAPDTEPAKYIDEHLNKIILSSVKDDMVSQTLDSVSKKQNLSDEQIIEIADSLNNILDKLNRDALIRNPEYVAKYLSDKVGGDVSKNNLDHIAQSAEWKLPYRLAAKNGYEGIDSKLAVMYKALNSVENRDPHDLSKPQITIPAKTSKKIIENLGGIDFGQDQEVAVRNLTGQLLKVQTTTSKAENQLRISEESLKKIANDYKKPSQSQTKAVKASQIPALDASKIEQSKSPIQNDQKIEQLTSVVQEKVALKSEQLERTSIQQAGKEKTKKEGGELQTQGENKDVDISRGYVVAKSSDDEISITRKAFKSEKYQDERGNLQTRPYNTTDFVNEFVTAPLYQEMLGDRAPTIELVASNDKDSSIIESKSKFSREFETVASFTEAQELSSVGPAAIKLRGIQGAEKLFASMLMTGDYDIGGLHTGVMDVKDEQGNNTKVFAKIDHGSATSQFFTNPGTMMENFANAYQKYGYDRRVYRDGSRSKPAVEVNVTKLKAEIDGMLKIPDKKIEQVIKDRVNQLKESGFDIKGLSFNARKNDKDHDYRPFAGKTFNNFEELEKHYVEHYKTQRQTMQSLSQRLGVIERIQHPSSRWKDGKWLTDIKGQNIERWCFRNGIKIEPIKEAAKDATKQVTKEQEEIQKKGSTILQRLAKQARGALGIKDKPLEISQNLAGSFIQDTSNVVVPPDRRGNRAQIAADAVRDRRDNFIPNFNKEVQNKSPDLSISSPETPIAQNLSATITPIAPTTPPAAPDGVLPDNREQELKNFVQSLSKDDAQQFLTLAEGVSSGTRGASNKLRGFIDKLEEHQTNIYPGASYVKNNLETIKNLVNEKNQEPTLSQTSLTNPPTQDLTSVDNNKKANNQETLPPASPNKVLDSNVTQNNQSIDPKEIFDLKIKELNAQIKAERGQLNQISKNDQNKREEIFQKIQKLNEEKAQLRKEEVQRQKGPTKAKNTTTLELAESSTTKSKPSEPRLGTVNLLEDEMVNRGSVEVVKGSPQSLSTNAIADQVTAQVNSTIDDTPEKQAKRNVFGSLKGKLGQVGKRVAQSVARLAEPGLRRMLARDKSSKPEIPLVQPTTSPNTTEVATKSPDSVISTTINPLFNNSVDSPQIEKQSSVSISDIAKAEPNSIEQRENNNLTKAQGTLQLDTLSIPQSSVAKSAAYTRRLEGREKGEVASNNPQIDFEAYKAEGPIKPDPSLPKLNINLPGREIDLDTLLAEASPKTPNNLARSEVESVPNSSTVRQTPTMDAPSSYTITDVKQPPIKSAAYTKRLEGRERGEVASNNPQIDFEAYKAEGPIKPDPSLPKLNINLPGKEIDLDELLAEVSPKKVNNPAPSQVDNIPDAPAVNQTSTMDAPSLSAITQPQEPEQSTKRTLRRGRSLDLITS